MIKPEYVNEAEQWLIDHWGDDAIAVIEATKTVTPYNDTIGNFIHTECIACGGDWGAMLLTGIKSVYPEIWNLIPRHMGKDTFWSLCFTLLLCGVDTSE